MYVWKLWFKEGFVGLFRNLWWNAIAVLLSFVCLLVFLFSYALGYNAEFLSKQLNGKLEIQVSLKDSVKDSRKLQESFMDDKRVRSVRYVSKEEALQKVKKEMDDVVLDLFKENIFPAQFIIKVKDVKDIEPLAKEIKGMSFASDVTYGAEYVSKLLKITSTTKQVGYGVTVVGAIFTIFFVMLVIRINIEQRKDEIRIKKLIGSSLFTIRAPFIIESVFLMIISGIISYIVFCIGYEKFIRYFVHSFPYVEIVTMPNMLGEVTIPLVLVVFAIAFAGSLLSTHKHLRKY